MRPSPHRSAAGTRRRRRGVGFFFFFSFFGPRPRRCSLLRAAPSRRRALVDVRLGGLGPPFFSGDDRSSSSLPTTEGLGLRFSSSSAPSSARSFSADDAARVLSPSPASSMDASPCLSLSFFPPFLPFLDLPFFFFDPAPPPLPLDLPLPLPLPLDLGLPFLFTSSAAAASRSPSSSAPSLSSASISANSSSCILDISTLNFRDASSIRVASEREMARVICDVPAVR
mmetsp:Transcript_25725/g.75937  ORF Transcript_25725/g.75937 Transcript_25725/m.75937 type:complete len:227 (-) Transcript_25725:78-758(-)